MGCNNVIVEFDNKYQIIVDDINDDKFGSINKETNEKILNVEFSFLTFYNTVKLFHGVIDDDDIASHIFFDVNGMMVGDKYSFATGFKSGICIVEIDKNYNIINKNGKLLLTDVCIKEIPIINSHNELIFKDIDNILYIYDIIDGEIIIKK